MRQQGLNAIQYLPNGYDHDFMDKNGGFFEGSVVLVQEAPIETTPKFPALQNYIKWMDKGGYKKTSLIHPENRASIRVAEHLGEKLEGRTELFGHEVLVYGIDREDS